MVRGTSYETYDEYSASEYTAGLSTVEAAIARAGLVIESAEKTAGTLNAVGKNDVAPLACAVRVHASCGWLTRSAAGRRPVPSWRQSLNDNSSPTRHDPSLQKILESKRALRRELAARPVAEKLRMLEAMRERTISIQRARSDEAREIERP
jgi:hypothetical protein